MRHRQSTNDNFQVTRNRMHNAEDCSPGHHVYTTTKVVAEFDSAIEAEVYCNKVDAEMFGEHHHDFDWFSVRYPVRHLERLERERRAENAERELSVPF